MGKRAKPSPFAPLERDVDPPLRKLSFVRARRADPPLVSEEAARRMIVLDTQSQPGARDARGSKSANEELAAGVANDVGPSANGRTDSEVNPLYPRAAVRMEWPGVRHVGSGLANLGNTCFLNAVTQCLTHTPPLASFCLAGEHKKFSRGGSNNRDSSGGFDPMYEMGEHVCKALSSPGRAIAPINIVKHLRSISKTFRKGRQEDAHEFARCVLDAMHKRCCDAAVPRAKEGSSRSETSFVWRTFGGTLRSRITCHTCWRTSDTFDGFMDLSLDIARSASVSDALREYVKAEVLDGRNKYTCELGPGPPHAARATKQFTVEKAPLILTVQLKRFEYVPFGRGKLNQFVEYPLELNLSGAMSGAAGGSAAAGGKKRGKHFSGAVSADAAETYDLFGVVVHSGGSMHSGHYYCYVKGPTGHWYEMDDETTTQCGESAALKQRAYLLFYAKRNTGLDGNARRLDDSQVERTNVIAQTTSVSKDVSAPVPAARASVTRADLLEDVPDSKRTPQASDQSDARVRVNSVKSPRRGGALLSSRDSARLRLVLLCSERLARRRARRRDATVSGEKRLERFRNVSNAKEAFGMDGPSSFPAHESREETHRAEERATRGASAVPGDAGSVKRWLRGSARAANVVGRGEGNGRGWDDLEDVGAREKTERRASGDARRRVHPGVTLQPGSKRRAYDDLDEAYDRGKVSKGARRKEKKTDGLVFGSGGKEPGGKKKNPFQSKAKSSKT